MTIVASNGTILARPSGGVLATDCGGFTCASPGIVGCAGCSCCGSRYYQVCVSGASGDCAVINSGASGWMLDNGGSGGSYVYDLACPHALDRFRARIRWNRPHG